MTPQEKAEEILYKFKNSECKDGYNDVRDIFASKRCALIAVDEILSILFQHHEIDYWKEVKQEIEKL